MQINLSSSPTNIFLAASAELWENVKWKQEKLTKRSYEKFNKNKKTRIAYERKKKISHHAEEKKYWW